jgi:hypothetical protein
MPPSSCHALFRTVAFSLASPLTSAANACRWILFYSYVRNCRRTQICGSMLTSCSSTLSSQQHMATAAAAPLSRQACCTSMQMHCAQRSRPSQLQLTPFALVFGTVACSLASPLTRAANARC